MSEAGSPEKGWENGLNLIKQIFGNARNLTDAAGKVPHDVATGNAAAGMAIDTYGFTEQEWNALQFDDKPHFFYVAPKGGTAVSADPVQLLRGAPNRPAAQAFIDFLLSPEGQKLHAFKVGTPGGPRRHALRRPPIRRDLYQEKYREFRSDPDYNPYESGASFTYRPEWTAPYYSLLRILLRCIALDGSIYHCCTGCLAPGEATIASYAMHPWKCNDIHAAGPVILAFGQAEQLYRNQLIPSFDEAMNEER